jgi:hypothetical protein
MKIIRLADAKEWPVLGSLSPEELKEAYALARAEFTADDLQKFTEIDQDEVPMEAFIAELEKAQQDREQSRG